jgi:uncharacterized DUF497 family protein
MAEISIRNVAKQFGDFTALHSIDLTVADPDDSSSEPRFLIFGRSAAGHALVVSFTERGESIQPHLGPPHDAA